MAQKNDKENLVKHSDSINISNQCISYKMTLGMNRNYLQTEIRIS